MSGYIKYFDDSGKNVSFKIKYYNKLFAKNSLYSLEGKYITNQASQAFFILDNVIENSLILSESSN